MSVPKPSHASSAAVRRAIGAVASGGITVGSVKLYPDGTIELIGEQVALPVAMNDFDRLDRDGLL